MLLAEVDPDGLRTWTKEELSAYKVPCIFQFVEALPKRPMGKVLKRRINRDVLRRPHAGARAPLSSEAVGVEPAHYGIP